MSTAIIIAIYAAIVSTIALAWRIYEFYFDKKGKLKIGYEFYPNFLIGDCKFTAIYEFTIVNIATRKRIINSVCHEYNTLKGGLYSPIYQHLKCPVALEFGENTKYEIDYADFDNLMEESKATKIRIIVTDSVGKTYKSKWVKVEKIGSDHLNNRKKFMRPESISSQMMSN